MNRPLISTHLFTLLFVSNLAYAKTVAIIGGGIAGSSAAYFLAQANTEENLELHVFEKSDTAGGRTKSQVIDGARRELGGSLIHSTNKYAMHYAQLDGLGFAVDQPSDGRTESVSIWDGQQLRHLFDADFKMPFQLFYSYGFKSLYNTKQLAADAVERFAKIYELQERGEAFDTPKEMIESLGLYEFSQQRSDSFFLSNGVGSAFINDVITGLSRVNYMQDSDINALASLISLAGGGFAGGNLYRIKAGNAMLSKTALDYSNARLHLNTRIKTVTILEDQRFELVTESSDAKPFIVDAVIIAAPLEQADIDIFIKHENITSEIPRREFVHLYRTYVAGNLNPQYFNKGSGEAMPDVILTSARENSPFTILNSVGKSARYTRNYTLFSFESLVHKSKILNDLFCDVKDVSETEWYSYPKLGPTQDHKVPAFTLAPFLYYANAMETYFSSIESQAVAGRNVANLLIRDLEGNN